MKAKPGRVGEAFLCKMKINCKMALCVWLPWRRRIWRGVKIESCRALRWGLFPQSQVVSGHETGVNHHGAGINRRKNQPQSLPRSQVLLWTSGRPGIHHPPALLYSFSIYIILFMREVEFIDLTLGTRELRTEDTWGFPFAPIRHCGSQNASPCSSYHSLCVLFVP